MWGKPFWLEHRLVRNPKRARLLRNRGEYIWWSNEHAGWLWKPKG